MNNTCKFNRVSHYSPAWGSAQVQFTPSDTTNKTATPTSNPDTPGQSGKWYDGLWGAVGELFKVWQPSPKTEYVVNNPEQKDNTMLYVGIGGVVLVVVLFLVIALKK